MFYIEYFADFADFHILKVTKPPKLILKKYTERLILTAVKETKTQKTKYIKSKKCICRFFNCHKDQSFRIFFYFKCFTDPGLLKIRQLSTPCRCGLSSL